MVLEQSVPGISQTNEAIADATVENLALAMQCHDEDFLTNTKKLLANMTDTTHHVKELAANTNTTFQPLVKPVQASPPSVTAPTSTSITTIGHAMAATTPSANTTLTAKSLSMCSMVCPDRDTRVHTSMLTPATIGRQEWYATSTH